MGKRIEVLSVDQQWMAPDGRHFRVSCEQGQFFELTYSESDDTWQVVPA
jgi:hypothetical protein